MIVERMPVPCSLSEVGLGQAANMLGGVPLHELTVYCAPDDRIRARQLGALHGFAVVIVPEVLLRHDRSFGPRWGVEHVRGIVWTDSP